MLKIDEKYKVTKKVSSRLHIKQNNNYQINISEHFNNFKVLYIIERNAYEEFN